MALLDTVPNEVMRSMKDPNWTAPRPGESEEQRAGRVARIVSARRALASRITPQKDPTQ